MTSTYLPQHYPLFVALGNLRLPLNIGEPDPTRATRVAFRAVKDQLYIHRVVAWLIEDTPEENVLIEDTPEGNVIAIPVSGRNFEHMPAR